MNASPLVSIVIPTHNSANYIAETVDGCLAQTYPNCEVIVVDDGSTDDTRTLLEQRYSDRIRYAWQENRGPAAARNHGARLARGEFLAFCDADDVYLPEKIAHSIALFQSRPDADVVYGRYEFMDAQGNPLPDYQPPEWPTRDVFCALLTSLSLCIAFNAITLRRSVFEASGGLREDDALRSTEDWEFMARLASRWTFAAADEVFFRYRHYPGSLSKNRLRITLGRLTMIQYARDLPGRERCVDDAAYDRLEAGRHYMLGLVYWEMGRRGEARLQFREADRLNPQGGILEHLAIPFSYFLPAASMHILSRMGDRVRSLRRR